MLSKTATQTETPGRARFAFPRLALRQRTNDHPMVMFAVIVSAAFASMVLVPSSGPAFAAIDNAPMKVTDAVRTAHKTSRLLPASEADRACAGQAWGTESLDCLLMIAQESGHKRQIRMIASAEPDSHSPNIF